ncbi:PREDICTED: COX assembly mitochondrial protein homolog [Chinchilla lanigera]|nr:PREDICTED: COX assembly mitochondrial protein homolog [Chinchilla lanigera]
MPSDAIISAAPPEAAPQAHRSEAGTGRFIRFSGGGYGRERERETPPWAQQPKGCSPSSHPPHRRPGSALRLPPLPRARAQPRPFPGSVPGEVVPFQLQDSGGARRAQAQREAEVGTGEGRREGVCPASLSASRLSSSRGKRRVPALARLLPSPPPPRSCPRLPSPPAAMALDPADQHLRHVEKDVLIPKIMREKARERCSEQVQDFTKCCKDSGILMVVKCRKENSALKECLTAYYNDPAFYEECKMEYLNEREEFRRTGIPRKKRLQKLPTSM